MAFTPKRWNLINGELLENIDGEYVKYSAAMKFIREVKQTYLQMVLSLIQYTRTFITGNEDEED